MPKSSTNNLSFQDCHHVLDARSLQRIQQGAKRHYELETLLRDVLPAHLYEAVHAHQIEGTCLIMTVSSASWATRLRALSSDILYATDRCRSLSRIDNLRIQICPKTARSLAIPGPNKKRSEPTKPSAESIESVEILANNCENAALRKALERLKNSMENYNPKKEC